MPKKKLTIAKLKKKLQIHFNKYIRLRDCLEHSGNLYEGICISCDALLPFEKLQAGHFIPSTYLAVRFDEDNVNSQCVGCNMYKSGNLIEYRPRLVDKITKERVENLEYKRHDNVKFTRQDYEDLIELYKFKINEIQNGKIDF